MRADREKTARFLLILLGLGLLLLSALLIAPRYLVISGIKQGIEVKVDSLRQAGYTILYDSLLTEPWANMVRLTGIRIQFPPTTSCDMNPDILSANNVTIEGIDYLSLLLKKEVHVETVSARNLIWRTMTRHGNTHTVKPSKVHDLRIHHLNLQSMIVEQLDSVACTVSGRTQFDLDAQEIEVHQPFADVRQWSVSMMRITEVSIHLPQKLYTISAALITYEQKEQHLAMDSFAVVPDLDKFKFAQKLAVQCDWIHCAIPHLEASSFILEQSGFHAGTITLSADLEIFRDKRYPFPHTVKSMPVDFFHALPIKMTIDSVQIVKSRVTYEEFPDEGTKAGKVFFHDLTAAIGNVSTTSSEGMTMSASTSFMNKGTLRAKFTFPADPRKAYSVSGTLTNFGMVGMNPLLIPMANAEVKSGDLHELAFQYDYNSYRADGSVTIDYDDLTVIALSKNSQGKTNKLNTLILQSFILKKEMDKTQRKGTILFYRDNERSIFNYWWKSVWAGIKSLFNLDRVMKIDRSKKE